MGATEVVPPVLRALGVGRATVDWMMGGGGTTESMLSGWLMVYLYWYVMLHVLFYTVGVLLSAAARSFSPKLACNRVGRRTVWKHILEAEAAFPILNVVGFLSEQLRIHNVSAVREDVAACGGWPAAVALSVLWFLLAELFTYLNHMVLLHHVPWLKGLINHHIHHESKRADEMTFWSGYNFSGVDGLLQSLPIVYVQLLCPAPKAFVGFYSAATAVWTMYIHGGPPLGSRWLMGPEYHEVHHQCGGRENSYNYGFYTPIWDWAFGTLKHPQPGGQRRPDAPGKMH